MLLRKYSMSLMMIWAWMAGCADVAYEAGDRSCEGLGCEGAKLELVRLVNEDACPDDPDKLEPGECGCGELDKDSDGDGVLDCNDACPEDSDKVEPGEVGCGQKDEDSDKDGVPDTLDECPFDADKSTAGLCGCDQVDSPQNTSDDDEDGVINCLDGCPNNATKIEPLENGCDVDDRDRDGYDDEADACPTNPEIQTAEQQYPISKNVQKWAETQLEISTDKDIVEFVETILKAERCLIDSDRVYHVFDASDLVALPVSVEVKTVRFEADIDLNNWNEQATNKCHEAFSGKLYDEPIELDGGGRTLSFSAPDGTRCLRHNALFGQLVKAHDLTLDLDYEGQFRAVLAEEATGELSNLIYRGTASSGEHYVDPAVGGIFGHVHDCVLKDVVADQASFFVNKAWLGVIAYSIERCRYEYTRPNHVRTLRVLDGQASGFADSVDEIYGVHNIVDQMSGSVNGLVNTAQKVSHVINEVGEADGGTGLMGTCWECVVEAVKNTVGEMRHGSALFGTIWGRATKSPAVMTDILNEVTGTLENSTALAEKVTVIGPEIGCGSGRSLVQFERVESKVQQFRLNGEDDSPHGALIGVLDHEQIVNSWTKSCDLDYLPPMVSFDKVIARFPHIEASANKLGILIGKMTLNEGSDCDNDINFMERPLTTTLGLKSVYLLSDVWSDAYQSVAQFAHSILANRMTDTCNTAKVYNLPQYPDWKILDADHVMVASRLHLNEYTSACFDMFQVRSPKDLGVSHHAVSSYNLAEEFWESNGTEFSYLCRALSSERIPYYLDGLKEDDTTWISEKPFEDDPFWVTFVPEFERVEP